jgi:hypothetical protein
VGTVRAVGAMRTMRTMRTVRTMRTMRTMRTVRTVRAVLSNQVAIVTRPPRATSNPSFIQSTRRGLSRRTSSNPARH